MYSNSGVDSSYNQGIYLSSFGLGSDKIILDFDSDCLKAGFSGEYKPLIKIPLRKEQQVIQDDFCETSFRLSPSKIGLFENPLRENDLKVINQVLKLTLIDLYKKYLLLDSRLRKVVIVESPSLPDPIKKLISKILLKDMFVPSITFFPGSLMSLMTLGKLEGLVVECGFNQTSITPVFDGRPLELYSKSTSIGYSQIQTHLSNLLCKHATYSLKGSENKSLLSDSILTFELTSHIIDNFMFASPLSPPLELIVDKNSPKTERYYNVTSDFLFDWYQQNCMASDIEFTWKTLSEVPITISIPGWIRERIFELFFFGDFASDLLGIVPLIVKIMKSVPVDLRRTLISQILVVGGLSVIPNLRLRILKDLVTLLLSDDRCKPLADSAALCDEVDPALQIDSVENDITSTINKNDVFNSHEKDTKNVHYKNSGLVFSPLNRAWIGTSIATSANINGFEISLDNFDEFGVSSQYM
ncbi:hypothetical protein BB559_001100 [Furculomyces boomerangus]|uniref:Actin-like ATPase domain-containing protein n=2 Tax=Harpellales TaxID=61421 RepID=A0A2T9XZ49_9FUNG|nr:hypothetical protein BB559_007061 [Furculomyces boomerangus]PVU98995.1 hypothetical protein BB559_001100 [Furculomyces boomerangus]PVZ97785.1 hypothetical protein BB558_006252 [Smittium angustum]